VTGVQRQFTDSPFWESRWCNTGETLRWTLILLFWEWRSDKTLPKTADSLWRRWLRGSSKDLSEEWDGETCTASERIGGNVEPTASAYGADSRRVFSYFILRSGKSAARKRTKPHSLRLHSALWSMPQCCSRPNSLHFRIFRQTGDGNWSNRR